MLPNPWGGAGGGDDGIAGANLFNPWAANGGGGMMPGMAAQMQGMINGQQQQQQPPNLEQVTQILENPMMMNMMQQMVDSNPDMIRQMMEAQNPMLRQIFAGQSPEQANQFIRQMMNPQNLRNMMQMQQAMSGFGLGSSTATAAAPQGGMMMPPFLPRNASTGSSVGGAPPVGLDFSNLLQGTGVGSSGGAAATFPPMDFGALMQNMQFAGSGGGGAAAGGPGGMFFPPPSFGAASIQQQQIQHPADRFRYQLQSLRDMGFDDELANLAALQQTHGNLNRAVDQLLMGPPSSTTVPTPTSSSSAPSPAPLAPTTTTTTTDNNNNNNNIMPGDPANTPTDDKPKDAEDKKND